MVEFCSSCGTSLPSADLTFRGGEVFVSHDFACPDCGKPVNPPPATADLFPSNDDNFAEMRDIVIANGAIEQCSPVTADSEGTTHDEGSEHDDAESDGDVGKNDEDE